jgi:hypothetical protein
MYLALLVAVDDGSECGGQISQRIDAIEFTGLDQRGDCRPVLGPRVVSGKKRVLTIKRLMRKVGAASPRPFLLPARLGFPQGGSVPRIQQRLVVVKVSIAGGIVRVDATAAATRAICRQLNHDLFRTLNGLVFACSVTVRDLDRHRFPVVPNEIYPPARCLVCNLRFQQVHLTTLTSYL